MNGNLIYPSSTSIYLLPSISITITRMMATIAQSFANGSLIVSLFSYINFCTHWPSFFLRFAYFTFSSYKLFPAELFYLKLQC